MSEFIRQSLARIGAKSKSAFAVLFVTVFLDFLGFSIVLPYLFFYAQSLGATPLVYGLLVTSYAFAQFVCAPILGRLSDRYGRRRILLFSLLGSSISYFGFGIAGTIWLLFLFRILAGSMSATAPIAQAYVADTTSEGNERLKYMGLLSAAFGIGFIIGPALGGILSNAFGYSIPSFLAAGLALTNLTLAYFRLPESPASQEETLQNKRRLGLKVTIGLFKSQRNVLGLILILNFITVFAFEFLDISMSPWLQREFNYGPFEVGLIFFYIGIVLVLTQVVLLPRLSVRRPPASLAMIGIAALSLGYFGMGISSNVILAMSFGAVLSVGYGLIGPAIATLISLNAPPHLQGSTLGVGQSLSSLASVLAPSAAAGVFVFGSSIGVNGLGIVVAAGINALAIPFLFVARKNGCSGA